MSRSRPKNRNPWWVRWRGLSRRYETRWDDLMSDMIDIMRKNYARRRDMRNTRWPE